MLEKTIESPFNCKEIQPIHPKASGATPGRATQETQQKGVRREIT